MSVKACECDRRHIKRRVNTCSAALHSCQATFNGCIFCFNSINKCRCYLSVIHRSSATNVLFWVSSLFLTSWHQGDGVVYHGGSHKCSSLKNQ